MVSRDRPTQSRRVGTRLPARRRKQQSGNRAVALGRELLGRLGTQTQLKGSRKGPALLGLAAALGAAGAAAIKRRRGAGDDQGPGYFPPSEPVGEAPAETEATPQRGN